jgi:hypothetical protein
MDDAVKRASSATGIPVEHIRLGASHTGGLSRGKGQSGPISPNMKR